MGGIACQIERNAKLQYADIPTNPHELKQFDAQLRECFTLPHIVDSIASGSDWGDVCELLAKPAWSDADRRELYGYLEGLWSAAPAS